MWLLRPAMSLKRLPVSPKQTEPPVSVLPAIPKHPLWLWTTHGASGVQQTGFPRPSEFVRDCRFHPVGFLHGLPQRFFIGTDPQSGTVEYQRFMPKYMLTQTVAFRAILIRLPRPHRRRKRLTIHAHAGDGVVDARVQCSCLVKGGCVTLWNHITIKDAEYN